MGVFMKRFLMLVLLASLWTVPSSSYARNKGEWINKVEKIKDKWKDKSSSSAGKWKKHDKWKNKGSSSKGSWKDHDKWKNKWKSNGSSHNKKDDKDDKKYVQYYKCRYVESGKWFSRSYFTATDKRKSVALRRAKQRCEVRQGEPFGIEVCEEISCSRFGRYE
jgi:hypothetical protein